MGSNPTSQTLPDILVLQQNCTVLEGKWISIEITCDLFHPPDGPKYGQFARKHNSFETNLEVI